MDGLDKSVKLKNLLVIFQALTDDQKKTLSIDNYNVMTFRWPLLLLCAGAGFIGSITLSVTKAMDMFFELDGWGGGFFTYVFFLFNIILALT